RSMVVAAGVMFCALLAVGGAAAVMLGNSGDDDSQPDPKELSGYYGHRSPVQALTVSPDGSSVASGDAAGQIWIWDAQSRHERGMLPGQTGGVNSLAISLDNK